MPDCHWAEEPQMRDDNMARETVWNIVGARRL
jgi:hypothetical protein